MSNTHSIQCDGIDCPAKAIGDITLTDGTYVWLCEKCMHAATTASTCACTDTHFCDDCMTSIEVTVPPIKPMDISHLYAEVDTINLLIDDIEHSLTAIRQAQHRIKDMLAAGCPF